MSDFSKRAIWLAVNSEYGGRLVEIAQEHTRLARELTTNKHLKDENRDLLSARVGQLRNERDWILTQFEGR